MADWYKRMKPMNKNEKAFLIIILRVVWCILIAKLTRTDSC